MTYKFETNKMRIPKEYDRRRKLTDTEREEIKQLYGTISQRKLAKKYGVSRRLIVFIGDPEQHKKNLIAKKMRGKEGYKKINAEYMKKHRRYKKKLYDGGKLIKNEI